MQLTNSAALGAALMLAGEAPGRYVEIEAQLFPDLGVQDRCSASPVTTPRLLASRPATAARPPIRAVPRSRGAQRGEGAWLD